MASFLKLMYRWLACLVEKPEPNDDRESVDLDPSASPLSSAEPSSASTVVEEPEPTPSASLLSAASIVEIPEAAPSSSSTAHRWKYDVFLSFRGPDTRRSITSDLYHRLQNERGISTFMDDSDLEVGDPIPPTLQKAIEDSRIAIVVLSPNYASSTWCLEELTKICECMKDNNRILPLFYNVEPSHVRHLKSGTSFGEAFHKHKRSERHSSGKVQQWKDALNKVASFSGWDANNFKTERELVDAIVDFVCTKVPPIEAYEATRKAMVEVMKALKDDDVTAVGVYGMGGVGKTTMVQHVGAEACKKRIFDHLIMAVVSQNPDIERIQQRFLAKLLGHENFTESGRASRLYEEIMRKKKILIILDDIWSPIDLSRIGIPSHDKLKQCNSKVLLTTRSLHVCNRMSQARFPLNTLSEPDSWSLFVKNTQRSFECREFEDVAKTVAGECRGLPIALIAVARALGDEDLVEWKKAALQLKKSQIANPDHEDDAFKCLKVSYDYLKDENYKSYFLLCCLFPEDYDIPIEDLLRYAIGKGLFEDTDTIDEARGIADSVVKHLIDSSLLLVSAYGGRYVRMHDVVRDTAMRIAKIEDGGNGFLVRAGCGLNDWPSRSHEGYSAISLMQNNIRTLPTQLVAPKLQILLLQQNFDLNEIPEEFIQSLNELRVLDLSFTNISLLPHQSFSLPTNLQGLYLDYCKRMSDISVIGKLEKLEILSMRNSPLKELSRELEHLTSLRMLDVSSRDMESSIVTIPSGVISKLHRLEELYMIGCGFKNWGRQIEGEGEGEGEGEETNMGFGEIAGLPKLKILQVSLSGVQCIPENVEVEPGWVYFDIHIGGDTTDAGYRFDHNSRSLCLRKTTAAMSALPDWFVNAVTSKTEKLLYDCCKGMSDIVKEFDHGRLHELKHLTVVGSPLDSYVYMEELMSTTGRVQKGPVFEKLEELHLINLVHLKELCVGELPPRSLSNLKALHMDHCPILKNVSEFVQRLPNLEKLYLDSCRKIDISGIGKLEKLEILSIRAYPLNELSREIEHLSDLTSLRMLDVSSRDTEGSIVTIPSGVISKLHRLEELYMIGCGFKNWGRQIEGEGEETNLGFGEIAGLPKLKILQVSLSGVQCIPENVEVEPGWVYFDIHIGGDTTDAGYRFDHNSRSLCLRKTTAAMSALPDWFVNVVTSKTEKLLYDCCKGMSDIVKEFDHGRLHELKHLTVVGSPLDSYVYMEELMNTTGRVQKGPVFEKLEELHLINLVHLKEWCVGELPPRSLSNLKVLRIRSY